MPQTLAKPKNPEFEKTRRRGPDGRFLADAEPGAEQAALPDDIGTTRCDFKSRRDAVLVEHREAIQEIAARRRLRFLALVGSVARGEDTEESDCDFLVGLPDDAGRITLAGVRRELRALLGCKVEVVPDGEGFRNSEYAATMLRDAVRL